MDLDSSLFYDHNVLEEAIRALEERRLRAMAKKNVYMRKDCKNGSNKGSRRAKIESPPGERGGLIHLHTPPQEAIRALEERRLRAPKGEVYLIECKLRSKPSEAIRALEERRLREYYYIRYT